MNCWRNLALALSAVALLTPLSRGDDWPQWLGPHRDSVWHETGILERFPQGGPPVRWRVPVHYGYSGPAVAGGRVFVTDYVTKDKFNSDASGRNKLKGTERVLCLNAADGKLLWKYEYDCPYHISYPNGPRCTPTVCDGKVYTLGAMGNLLCLDAVSGQLAWSHDLKKEYSQTAPLWGFAGHPLVDGKKLICLVGGKGSIAVAFDKDNGQELWRSLSAPEPGYCPPMLLEAGGLRQLIIWHPKALNSLDPVTGKVHWSVPLEPLYGMSISGPRQWGSYLFASGIGPEAAVLLKLADNGAPAPQEVWRGESGKGIFCALSTPFLQDDMIYGSDGSNGQLRGVRLVSGQRLWDTLAPSTGGKRAMYANIFLIKNGDRFFLANDQGQLIIARLSPKGYDELGRCRLLEPTETVFNRKVVWSHPAFAEKCVFARNHKELVCVSLAANGER